MLIKLDFRDSFNKFIRSISGIIPCIVLGARKGNAKGITFWQYRPFSRIVEWARDFKTMLYYIEKNIKESTGMISYTVRKIQDVFYFNKCKYYFNS